MPVGISTRPPCIDGHIRHRAYAPEPILSIARNAGNVRDDGVAGSGQNIEEVDLPTLGRPTSAMTGSTLPGRYCGGSRRGLRRAPAGGDGSAIGRRRGFGGGGRSAAGGFSIGSDGDGGPRRCNDGGHTRFQTLTFFASAAPARPSGFELLAARRQRNRRRVERA